MNKSKELLAEIGEASLVVPKKVLLALKKIDKMVRELSSDIQNDFSEVDAFAKKDGKVIKLDKTMNKLVDLLSDAETVASNQYQTAQTFPEGK